MVRVKTNNKKQTMNIKFADKEAFDRYVRCSYHTSELKNSLDKCIAQLMRWNPHDNTIVISRDFHDQSFFFQEIRKEGGYGMCGGIIFHGTHDNGGDGNAPTCSVNLTPCDGYAIHT